MKKNLLQFFILSALLWISPLSAQAAAETFTLDPMHTYVLWRIKHLGFSYQAGKWYATGTLILDKDKPQNSKVNALIQVADIITGIPELDKHLKSDKFFDVEKFPTATFASNKVEMTGKDSAKVYGALTLHGVSKPVVLDVKLNQAGNNPMTGNMTAGFTAKTQVKRSDFGITTYLPALADEVALEIDAEAFKPNK